MRTTDEFQYLTVLISIVLGLGIAQLLTGVGRLAQARGRVRYYWPALLWAVMLFFTLVQAWWSMFSMRDHSGWTFVGFLVVLATPTTLYLTTALVLPDVDVHAAHEIDLRTHYFAHRRWFFTAVAAVVLSSLLRPLALDGRLPLDLDRGIQLVFLAVCVGAVLVAREAFHKTVALVMVVLLGTYFALLFARLR